MSTEKLKAILFDLDDTILAYDAVAEPCWEEVCGQFAPLLGRDASELYVAIKEMREWYESDSERQRYVWVHLLEYRREVVGMTFDRLGITAPELAVALADSYSKRKWEAIHVVPGAMEALSRLKGSKLRLALVTNGDSKSQRGKIERFVLGHLFDYILIQEEFGAGKPDERVFLHALDKLNVKPDEAWMVSDNLERDIGGAQVVGISGIWVDWRGAGLPASTQIRPQRIIRSIAELF